MPTQQQQQQKNAHRALLVGGHILIVRRSSGGKKERERAPLSCSVGRATRARACRDRTPRKLRVQRKTSAARPAALLRRRSLGQLGAAARNGAHATAADCSPVAHLFNKRRSHSALACTSARASASATADALRFAAAIEPSRSINVASREQRCFVEQKHRQRDSAKKSNLHTAKFVFASRCHATPSAQSRVLLFTPPPSLVCIRADEPVSRAITLAFAVSAANNSAARRARARQCVSTTAANRRPAAAAAARTTATTSASNAANRRKTKSRGLDAKRARAFANEQRSRARKRAAFACVEGSRQRARARAQEASRDAHHCATNKKRKNQPKQNFRLADRTQIVKLIVENVYEAPAFLNQPRPFLAVAPLRPPLGLQIFRFEARTEGGDGTANVEYRLLSIEREQADCNSMERKRRQFAARDAPPFTVDASTGAVRTAASSLPAGATVTLFVQAHDRDLGETTRERDSEIAVLEGWRERRRGSKIERFLVFVGDRPPQWLQPRYAATLSEEATLGQV